MASMLEEWNDLFTALFFGEGSWLGLLIFIGFFTLLMVKWKYSATLFIPISIFIGIEYLNNELGWQALIMFFDALFMLVFLIKDVKK
jgi:hypothetical protein